MNDEEVKAMVEKHEAEIVLMAERCHFLANKITILHALLEALTDQKIAGEWVMPIRNKD